MEWYRVLGAALLAIFVIILVLRFFGDDDGRWL